jgi:hypothetical protein
METKTMSDELLVVNGYGYGEDAGIGFEDTGGKDISIPFLSILQNNSKPVENGDDGAKPGALYNSVTKEITESLTIIPVHKESVYVEWVSRENGGGFVGLRDYADVKQDIANSKSAGYGKIKTANGNELIETYYVYALVLNDEGTETRGFCVIPFTSSKIKPYRNWITSLYTIKGKPPLFAHRAVIKTVKQKNAKGSFYNYEIHPLRSSWVTSLIDPKKEAGLLQEAKDFREVVGSGLAKVDYAAQENSDFGASPDQSSDDAPF